MSDRPRAANFETIEKSDPTNASDHILGQFPVRGERKDEDGVKDTTPNETHTRQYDEPSLDLARLLCNDPYTSNQQPETGKRARDQKKNGSLSARNDGKVVTKIL